MVTGAKSHSVAELFRELRSHALWDFLKELFIHILKYVGTVIGIVLAGVQWMEHHHGVLFFLGLIMGGGSLFSIGVAFGRKPSPKDGEVQAHQPEAIDQPQSHQKINTVRLIEEESETINPVTQTRTRTVRRIMEVTVTVLFCAAVGWFFYPYYGSEQTQFAFLSSSELQGNHTSQGSYKSDPRVQLEKLDRNKLSSPIVGAFMGSPAYRNDPEFPVWVLSDSNMYVCYGWEWEEAGRYLTGTWMKQSDARKLGKEPSDGKPCGFYTSLRNARTGEVVRETPKAAEKKSAK